MGKLSKRSKSIRKSIRKNIRKNRRKRSKRKYDGFKDLKEYLMDKFDNCKDMGFIQSGVIQEIGEHIPRIIVNWFNTPMDKPLVLSTGLIIVSKDKNVWLANIQNNTKAKIVFPPTS